MSPKAPWNLMFPPDLRARVVNAAHDAHETNSAWVNEACEMRLGSPAKDDTHQFDGKIDVVSFVAADGATLQCSSCDRCHMATDPCCALCKESDGARHSIGCDLKWEG